jgi:uncharacterized membrane protein
MKYFPPLELSFWQHCTRLLRHWFTFSWKTRQLLPADKREILAELIEQSELQHTGEIAIAFETRLPYSYLVRQARARERAWTVFSKMQVWDTPDDNGVLIYFLVAERRIEIVADRGIARLLEQTTWDAWVHELYTALHNNELHTGLNSVIAQIGATLAQHFPQSESLETDNRSTNQPQIL